MDHGKYVGYPLDGKNAGGILRERRLLQNMTQRQVAEKAKIAVQQYQRLESNEQDIKNTKFGLVCRVLEALNMDITAFYQGKYPDGPSWFPIDIGNFYNEEPKFVGSRMEGPITKIHEKYEGCHVDGTKTGIILRLQRVLQNMTMRQVAEKAKIAVQQYQRLERHEQDIMNTKFGLVCRVLEALNMDLTAFYHGRYPDGPRWFPIDIGSFCDEERKLGGNRMEEPITMVHEKYEGCHADGAKAGIILRLQRVLQNMTMRQVAEKAKIAVSQYQRLENNDRSIMTASFGLVCRVLEALNMDITAFYHGKYPDGPSWKSIDLGSFCDEEPRG